MDRQGTMMTMPTPEEVEALLGEIQRRDEELEEATQVALGVLEQKAKLEQQLEQQVQQTRVDVQHLQKENQQLQSTVESLESELGEMRRGLRKATWVATDEDKDDIIEQLESSNHALNQELRINRSQKSRRTLLHSDSMFSERSAKSRLSSSFPVGSPQEEARGRILRSLDQPRSRASTGASMCVEESTATDAPRRARAKSVGHVDPSQVLQTTCEELDALRLEHDEVLNCLRDTEIRLYTELEDTKAESLKYQRQCQELASLIQQPDAMKVESMEAGDNEQYDWSNWAARPGSDGQQMDMLLQEVTVLREQLSQANARVTMAEASGGVDFSQEFSTQPGASLKQQMECVTREGSAPNAPVAAQEWQRRCEASEQQLKQLQEKLAEVAKQEAELQEQVRSLLLGRTGLEAQLAKKTKEAGQAAMLEARLAIANDRLAVLDVVESELRGQVADLGRDGKELEGLLELKRDEVSNLYARLALMRWPCKPSAKARGHHLDDVGQAQKETGNKGMLRSLSDESLPMLNSSSHMTNQQGAPLMPVVGGMRPSASFQSCMAHRRTPSDKSQRSTTVGLRAQVDVANVEVRPFAAGMPHIVEGMSPTSTGMSLTSTQRSRLDSEESSVVASQPLLPRRSSINTERTMEELEDMLLKHTDRLVSNVSIKTVDSNKPSEGEVAAESDADSGGKEAAEDPKGQPPGSGARRRPSRRSSRQSMSDLLMVETPSEQSELCSQASRASGIKRAAPRRRAGTSHGAAERSRDSTQVQAVRESRSTAAPRASSRSASQSARRRNRSQGPLQGRRVSREFTDDDEASVNPTVYQVTGSAVALGSPAQVAPVAPATAVPAKVLQVAAMPIQVNGQRVEVVSAVKV